jgi:hypothetical protein
MSRVGGGFNVNRKMASAAVDFSCCHWKRESATFAVFLNMPPATIGNRELLHIQPIRKKVKVENIF